MHTFEVVCRNRSAYPIDAVWENAQDLEHVACLHARTNWSFKLIHCVPCSDGRYPYDTLVFSATRKLAGFIPMSSVGVRRIVGPYEIWQVEFNPLMRVTTRLRSTLERDPDEPERTKMIDYVQMTVPVVFKALEGYLREALRRHTRVQCAEDEEFRARRQELLARGIRPPVSLFNLPLWESETRGLKPAEWRKPAL